MAIKGMWKARLVACVAAGVLGGALSAQVPGAAGEAEFEFEPVTPWVGEPTVITVRGEWHDGCIPILGTVTWELSPLGLPALPRTDIVATLETWGESCPAAVTPFEVEIPLGTLTTPIVAVRVQVADPLAAGPVELVNTVLELPAGGRRTTLPLHQGRFEVSARWRLPAPGGVGGIAEEDAVVVPGFARDSGLFWFFDAENWELMVKVLDGCEINGHWWVLGSGSTNVGFGLVVHDTWSDATWSYENPIGQLAGTLADIEAIACNPSGGP